MQNRKKKLDEDHKSISQLIKVLDGRKNEAIERTFKGVSKFFELVFKELIGEGSTARLIIRQTKKRKAPEEEKEKEDKDEEERPKERTIDIEDCKGIKIEVSFPGSQPKYMQSYSGGQRSLIALALIFAIQRCDPAPFYLFDEIDSALDSQYR